MTTRLILAGLIGIGLGVVGWWLLRRPSPGQNGKRSESERESSDIDPGMVVTPPEVDSGMVIRGPDVDPGMVITPRPRREDESPPEVRM